MQTLVITIATGRTQFLIWERLSLDQTQPTSYSQVACWLRADQGRSQQKFSPRQNFKPNIFSLASLPIV